MTLFAALNVEIRIVSAMIFAAQGPSTALTAAAAIVSLVAVAAGPSAKRYAALAMRYRPIKTSEPSRKAHGKAFCGSVTSPALYVPNCQPSYAHRTAIMAQPKLENKLLPFCRGALTG